MDKIIYGSKMKKVDSYTMDVIGIPSMVLMERAAFSVFLYIKENIDKAKTFLCLCGTGNNGADGIALARMLKLAGYNVEIITVGNDKKATKEWLSQKEIAINCGVVMQNADEMCVARDKTMTYDSIRAELKTKDYVIDAIFGIGLTRNVEGIYDDIISSVNDERMDRKKTDGGLQVYALDVPSGLNSDTGVVMGNALQADITFTFGAMKTGLLLYKGKDISGKCVICDIGFPEKAYESGIHKNDICRMVTSHDMKRISLRKQHSNKGTYGKVTVIAGSENMYGAAYFSARAACEMGAGLVRIITHENNRNLIYDKLPEAMINVYKTYDSNTKSDTNLDINVDMQDEIESITEDAIKWCDSIVIGPGLSKSKEAHILVEYAMKLSKTYGKYIVIDADALNIIADNPKLNKYYHEKTVITPHIGESARLMGKNALDIAQNIIAEASEYARAHKINIIQKDATTVILGIESLEDKCNNRVCINTTGNPGMATGGSGDVLAGMVAAILAGGIDIEGLVNEMPYEKTFILAAMAVYIHGLAGDMATKQLGETSMTATDILNMIHIVLNRECEESVGNYYGKY